MVLSSGSILLYTFVVSLIVYDSGFVRSFSLQSSRYRFLSKSQYAPIRTSQTTRIYSDSDDYSSGEESDSKIFRDDLDDEILEDETAEDDDADDDDDENDDEDAAEGDGTTNSWQQRGTERQQQ
jgi:hypothetical protein